MTRAAPAPSSKRSPKTTSASAAPSRSRSCSLAGCAGPPRAPFRTRVFDPGTDVKIDFSYKHSRIKQYLKDGRALRIEAVINKPKDLDVLARLEHLPELIAKARAVNQRLLIIERAGHSCAIGSALFERIHQPYNREGHRTGALRFGDSRAMALAGALHIPLHAVTGFTNKSLRGHVAGLLGQPYNASKMSYDLRRLRLHGLIARLPHSNTYVLTAEEIRIAIFYSKLQNRLVRPLLDADKPPAPPPVRRALTTVEHTVNNYVHNARLAARNSSQPQTFRPPRRTSPPPWTTPAGT